MVSLRDNNEYKYKFKISWNFFFFLLIVSKNIVTLAKATTLSIHCSFSQLNWSIALMFLTINTFPFPKLLQIIQFQCHMRSIYNCSVISVCAYAAKITKFLSQNKVFLYHKGSWASVVFMQSKYSWEMWKDSRITGSYEEK